MNGLQLIATGGALPGRTITNDALSRMVDTSDAWITSRTGIRTRHWCTEDESAATLAIAAARQALDPLPLGALNHHNGDRHLCGGFAAMAQPRSQNVSICNS